PFGVAVDDARNVYVSLDSYDGDKYSILKITSAGQISHLINSAGNYGMPVAGPAVDSPFGGSAGSVAAAGDGTVYAGDQDHNYVVKVTPSGTLSIFAGTGSGTTGPLSPGDALDTTISPGPMAVGPDGSLYVYDRNAYQVLKITSSGDVT